MKRIAAVLILALLILALFAACFSSLRGEEPTEPTTEKTEPTTEQAWDTEPTTEQDWDTEPTTEPERETKPEPEEPTPPEEVVANLLASVKAWDADEINAYLPEGSTIESHVPAGFDSTIAALLARMEYKVGDAAVTGDTAAVEVTLTAADAEKALNDAVLAIVKKVALAKLMGREVGDYNALAGEAVLSIDVAALPAVTKDVTAYMLKDKNGEWKLDAENDSNLPLLDAATGGAITASGELAKQLEAYGGILG